MMLRGGVFESKGNCVSLDSPAHGTRWSQPQATIPQFLLPSASLTEPPSLL